MNEKINKQIKVNKTVFEKSNIKVLSIWTPPSVVTWIKKTFKHRLYNLTRLMYIIDV